MDNITKLTVLTTEDISKAESCLLTDKQLNFLFQRTPKNHIYKRPGRGGESWDYVTGTYFKKVLNLMFGFNWDFIVDKFDINMESKQVIVLGKLVCRTKDKTITKMQFGRADIKFKKGTNEPLDLGNDCKAASTDALKKCASELGIASDVYGKNEFKEVYIVDKKPSSDQMILIEELIEQSQLNDRERKSFMFGSEKWSSQQASEAIEGLKKMIDENTGLTTHEQHLNSIKNEISKVKPYKLNFDAD